MAMLGKDFGGYSDFLIRISGFSRVSLASGARRHVIFTSRKDYQILS